LTWWWCKLRRVTHRCSLHAAPFKVAGRGPAADGQRNSFVIIQAHGQTSVKRQNTSPPAPSRKSRPQTAFYSNVNALNKEAKALQPKCGQARERYGIGQHRASPTLLYKDGANRQERVRHPLFISLVIVPHNRNHCNPGPSRERALSLQLDPSTSPTPKGPPR
jgi:hypothetical protein